MIRLTLVEEEPEHHRMVQKEVEGAGHCHCKIFE
jgi:hypothetical protein